MVAPSQGRGFPFLFGGAFIEGDGKAPATEKGSNFPSFSEGLSLRVATSPPSDCLGQISLPFRRGFH